MKYEKPIIEIMRLEMQNVILTSGFGDNDNQYGGDEDGGFAPR